MTLVETTRALAKQVGRLSFEDPVTHVYNPLDYAWKPHEKYLQRFGQGKREIVFLGMNPGPFGMAQTGVPFGDVGLVRDWMGMEAPVRRPKGEHPKRPVLGFDCTRSEVSGSRLWGWAQGRFGTAEAFFNRFFVVNYCPLVFLEASGRNRTPDKLPVAEREPLAKACDRALTRCIEELDPEWVIGVGVWATRQAQTVLGDGVQIGTVLHPSPASPKANRGWAEQAEAQLVELGIKV